MWNEGPDFTHVCEKRLLLSASCENHDAGIVFHNVFEHSPPIVKKGKELQAFNGQEKNRDGVSQDRLY